MSEPQLISPLLDNFAVGDEISNHDGVRCYPALRKDTQERFILKVISIPASQIRLQALLMTGAYENEAQALEYFITISKEVIQEIGVLNKLAELEGFLPYEGYQVVQKDPEIGVDIYILSPFRKTLQRHLKKNTMTHLAAINLGLDLCACMALCRQIGQLYVDLKPSNIYMLDDKTFRIGDIGFVDLDSLKFTSLPDRYQSDYTAPEITDALSELNSTLDIFSIGLILYQVYNGGKLPEKGELVPPEYADYELAEIILKACDSDPSKRWQDPVEMGQALKSYMQRNGVNDDPIIPPPSLLDSEEVVPFEEEDDSDDVILFEQVDEAGQMMIEEMIDYSQNPVPGATDGENEIPGGSAAATVIEDDEDDPANLSFLDDLVSDETAPGEDTVMGVTYNELSEETSGILSLADDLIAAEVPAPVIAPEVTGITPIPAPAADQTESGIGADGIRDGAACDTESGNETNTGSGDTVVVVLDSPESIKGETEGEEVSGEDSASCTETIIVSVPGKTDAPVVSETSGNEDIHSEHTDYDEQEESGRSIFARVLAFILAGLILICLVIGGFIFYKEYYLKTVNALVLDGFEDRLNVRISTTADDSLLTIVCTDTYGNKLTAPVVDGSAAFGGLNADTLYTVSVEISGFHSLAGKTKDTYTTSPRTEIITFSSITGAEAGSAILSFTVNGQDSDEWTVTYVAEGEKERTEVFTGHMVTISGLTVGKTYTFTLESTDDLFVIGNNTVQHVASDLVYAENLIIESCDESGLTVRWDAPEGSTIESWTALCYSPDGYTQTITTQDTFASFTGVDPQSAYTVEISAEGMSVSARCYITENSVTATNVVATVNGNNLDITWNYSGSAPQSKWVILYSYGDSEEQHIVRSESTSVQIYPAIPGITYNLLISLEDGTTVFQSSYSVETPAADEFYGYMVTTQDMTFQMCLSPGGRDWTWRNVRTYKDTFKIGETAAFVMRLGRTYNTSPDMITIMYVIRDKNNFIVDMSYTSQTWTSMWYQSYGELEVPSIPQIPGNYTMDIYFNGSFVHNQNFTVE